MLVLERVAAVEACEDGSSYLRCGLSRDGHRSSNSLAGADAACALERVHRTGLWVVL
jgi:hypothetical protein